MEGENSLGQIRDLLVGPQFRSIEDRLREMSERWEHELHELRSDLNRRSETLESVIREELNNLRQQVEHNHAEHHSASQSQAAETAELLAHVNHTTKSFDERLGHAERELRHAMAEQIDTVQRELNASRDGLRYEMIEMLERMQQEKMDRSRIGQILQQVAESLMEPSEILHRSEVAAEGE